MSSILYRQRVHISGRCGEIVLVGTRGADYFRAKRDFTSFDVKHAHRGSTTTAPRFVRVTDGGAEVQTTDVTQGQSGVSRRGISRLREAFERLIGESLREELCELVDNPDWLESRMSVEEIFRLWVVSKFQDGDEHTWIFDLIRAGERKRLCEYVGISRSELVGKPPLEIARMILGACGLPVPLVWGHRRELQEWERIQALVEQGEDQLASVLLRQRAERVLKVVLHFHVATELARDFEVMLREPGSLRVPSRLFRAIDSNDRSTEENLKGVLTEDGWADLGFLLLAVRKLSKNFVENRGLPALLTVDEQKSFDALAVALQSYTHDKPKSLATRHGELDRAQRGARSSVFRMIQRGVVPDDLYVSEVGDTMFGPIVRGWASNGSTVAITPSGGAPPLGTRILYRANVAKDHALATWIVNPWPYEE